jgi:hypothetical protein
VDLPQGGGDRRVVGGRPPGRAVLFVPLVRHVDQDCHSVSPVEFAHVRMQLVAAVQDCRHAVEKLLDLHGSSTFVAGNPPGRFWRDLAVGTRHAAVRPWVTADDYGRVLTDDSATGPTPDADASRA